MNAGVPRRSPGQARSPVGTRWWRSLRAIVGCLYASWMLRAAEVPTGPDIGQPPALTDLAGVIPPDPVLVKSLGDAAEMVGGRPLAASTEQWARRRPEVARRFRQILGLDPWPERTSLNVRFHATNAFAGYTVTTVSFESRPGFPVTANLYRPVGGPAGRRPAVLSPIGHFLTPGKTAPDIQARCIGLARRGCVVLAYDAIGQGERMVPGNIHHDAGYALLPLGETIAGWMVWDSMRAIDFLLTLDAVDPDRIGITGNSGGGLNSLFTAAVDDRVRAAAVVGFTFEFGNWLKYGGAHCTCTHLPGVFQEMRWSEIAGLIAPRGLLMLQGANDGIFPARGARQSAAETGTLFRLSGVEGRVRYVELPGMPHAYSRPFREVMYGWMESQLLGGPDSPITEPPMELLPEGDRRLLCDPDRQWMPSATTVVDHARSKARAQSQSSRPPELTGLSNVVRRWSAIDAARVSYQASRVHHRSTHAGGGEFERVSFLVEEGLRLPLAWWHVPTGGVRKATLVVADSRGKSAFANTYSPAEWARLGVEVIAVDLRGAGETLGRYGPRYDTHFRLVANQVLAGRPLAACRAADLVRTLDFLATRPGWAPGKLAVAGLGDDALSALLAASIDPRIERLVMVDGWRSFGAPMQARIPPPPGTMGDAWNDPQLDGRIRAREGDVDFGSVLPGVLAFGDIADCVNSLRSRSVWMCGVRDRVVPDAPALHDRFRGLAAAGRPGWLQYDPEGALTVAGLVRWLGE